MQVPLSCTSKTLSLHRQKHHPCTRVSDTRGPRGTLAAMIARDWILDVLAELELWYWPIFLWELYWLDRYLTARRAEHRSGLVGYSVCKKGRIYITLQAFADKPDPNDWTAFAPREPWKRLSLDISDVWKGLDGREPQTPARQIACGMSNVWRITAHAPLNLIPP